MKAERTFRMSRGGFSCLRFEAELIIMLYITNRNLTDMQAQTEQNLTFIRRVDELRFRKGWTVDAVCEKIGMSRTMLHFIRKGKNNATNKALFKLWQAEKAEGISWSEEQLQKERAAAFPSNRSAADAEKKLNMSDRSGRRGGAVLREGRTEYAGVGLRGASAERGEGRRIKLRGAEFKERVRAAIETLEEVERMLGNGEEV